MLILPQKHIYASSATAVSISADTSTDLDASEAWLAAKVMIWRAFIRADMCFWLSGLIIRSSLEIGYQHGFFFHAGALILLPKVLARGAFCVTAITRASSAVRSWQKLS
jgi:hypothetical protein